MKLAPHRRARVLEPLVLEVLEVSWVRGCRVSQCHNSSSSKRYHSGSIHRKDSNNIRHSKCNKRNKSNTRWIKHNKHSQ